MKMKQLMRRRLLPALLSLLILIAALVPSLALSASAASQAVVTTTPTGYTKASDVVYKSFSQGSYSGVMNWGARGEDCVFLSPMAEDYYVGSYTYAVLSVLNGGTQSSAPSSALYQALQSMMQTEHSHIISYDATRPLYAYTDCVSNDSSQIVCFYTGSIETSTWNSGDIWNREHVWPRSKCVNQSKKQDSADLMMLRPELMQANSSRGNKAYGESSSFFDPGESVRGDCARIILYGYTRWGNTSYMWGSSGVIENLDILLRWMEEDPVDTWEMGRNDACESILGVRNVFVDYPEYAFLLFDREIPADMVTPSGIASSGVSDRPADSEPEFEMTQATPPPSAEPEFEMTQATPPPSADPEFEMTQATPPPSAEPSRPTTDPSVTEAEATEAESPSDMEPGTAETDAPSGGGCFATVSGQAGITITLISLAVVPLLAVRRRKE